MPITQYDKQCKPSNEGWVRIARAIRNHWLVGFGQPVRPYTEGRATYSRAEAWIDLIMECSYEPGSVTVNGQRIALAPGQLVGAITYLSERWNWSPKTVRVFMDNLAMADMANRGNAKGQTVGTEKGNQKGNQAAVITICNYAEYQIVKYLEGKHSAQERANATHVKGRESNNRTLKQEESEEKSASAFAARLPEIDAFNGSTPVLVEALAKLLNPKAPNLIEAHKQLEKLVKRLTRPAAPPTEGRRLEPEWVLSKSLGEWAIDHFVITPNEVRSEAAAFKSYWLSKTRDATKKDWPETWKNWIRGSHKKYKIKKPEDVAIEAGMASELDLLARKPQLSPEEQRTIRLRAESEGYVIPNQDVPLE